MRRAALLLFVLAVAAAGFAPAPLPRVERRRDQTIDLNGKWKFVVWKTGGQDNTISQKLDIRPGVAEFITLDDSSRAAYEFVLYPNLSPPGFKWKMKNRNEHYVGSYRTQGGRLILVFESGRPFAERPTDFSGKAAYHFELERQSR